MNSLVVQAYIIDKMSNWFSCFSTHWKKSSQWTQFYSFACLTICLTTNDNETDAKLFQSLYFIHCTLFQLIIHTVSIIEYMSYSFTQFILCIKSIVSFGQDNSQPCKSMLVIQTRDKRALLVNLSPFHLFCSFYAITHW